MQKRSLRESEKQHSIYRKFSPTPQTRSLFCTPNFASNFKALHPIEMKALFSASQSPILRYYKTEKPSGDIPMTRSTCLTLLLSSALLVACGEPVEDTADVTEERLEMLEAQADAMTEQAEDLAGQMGDMAQAEEKMWLKGEQTYPVVNASGLVIGNVTISERAEGVEINLDVTAIPAGSHAFHFHDVGTCDGPDFTSAGGHYNPGENMHGFEATDTPHAGDMRNFDAPASGVVKHTTMNSRVSLEGRDGFDPLRDANGTALIIHAEADDYESQPSGAAGARIACAVIN
jgi:Cu-Zn family superoxide dismutase